MYIVLSGVQGCGKGTQSAILVEKFGFKTFETGSIIRGHIKGETEIGKKVKAIVESGNLVGDDIIEEMLRDFMASVKEGENVIFDGVPRNIEQKRVFDKVVSDYKVLYMNLPKEEVEARLLGRRNCKDCKKVFPASYTSDKCDDCEGELFKRADDQDESAIKTRIDTFFEKTLPLIDEAREEGNVVEVNANAPIETVTEEILTKLNLK